MGTQSCHNCRYARFDALEWLHNAFFDLPLVPKCANHPLFPGVLQAVPGVPCENYCPKPAEAQDSIRRIPLGEGQYAIVDACDYESLRRYNWRLQNGYVARREKGKTIYMHQQIMQPPKGMLVDHHNHDRLDHRRSNLRVCTRRQNTHNNSKHRRASSRFKGVGYSKERRKWFAKLWFAGRRIWLGYFTDQIEAARAYDRAAVEHFREFACLNFPDEWPAERRQEVYARLDAAEKKEGKKAGRR